MAEVMRFWFRRGVDGFRVDAIFAAIKDDLLRDNPPDRRPSAIPGMGRESGQDPLWSMNRPEVHDVVRHLRRVAAEFPGRVLVGEAYLPVEELAGYLGHGADDEFHLVFDFEMLLTPWDHRDLTLGIERSEALHPPGAIPTYAFSNHDQSRQASRWGPERTRAAAFLLLTLRGVAVLYAGEEIGMIDADPSMLPDPPFDRAGRDGCRTPMQWDASPLGGFTDGTPWLPLVDPADAQRRRPGGRSCLAADALPSPDRGATGVRPRSRAERIGRCSASLPRCWRGCARPMGNACSHCSTPAARRGPATCASCPRTMARWWSRRARVPAGSRWRT